MVREQIIKAVEVDLRDFSRNYLHHLKPNRRFTKHRSNLLPSILLAYSVLYVLSSEWYESSALPECFAQVEYVVWWLAISLDFKIGFGVCCLFDEGHLPLLDSF